VSKTDQRRQTTPQDIVDAFEAETRTRTYRDVDYGVYDAGSIRRDHGLRPFWKQLYETDDAARIDTSADAVQYPGVVPDCLIHLRRDERELLKQDQPDLSHYPETRRHVLRWLAADDRALSKMSIGGTDFLGTGQPGSGKSTLACDLARQVLGINPEEAVVWRGTPSRAEWTPLAKWTKLLLPASVESTVSVEPPQHGAGGFKLDVEEIAREVEYYDDVFDLLERFEPGKFHVVYPDPMGKGVEDVFAQSARTDSFEWVNTASMDDSSEFDTPTPLSHWWFAFIVAIVDFMGPEFLTLFLDEIGDLLPQAARSGPKNHNWYEKIEAYRDALVDARKNNKSIFKFGHNEADVHSLVRRKLRWRITMPGWPNPTEGDKVVGFQDAPMTEQHTKYFNVGKGLWWTALHYSEFHWSDVPKPTVAKVAVELSNRGGSA
jgi:DNA polymerase III delta prime subunit